MQSSKLFLIFQSVIFDFLTGWFLKGVQYLFINFYEMVIIPWSTLISGMIGNLMNMLKINLLLRMKLSDYVLLRLFFPALITIPIKFLFLLKIHNPAI